METRLYYHSVLRDAYRYVKSVKEWIRLNDEPYKVFELSIPNYILSKDGGTDEKTVYMMQYDLKNAILDNIFLYVYYIPSSYTLVTELYHLNCKLYSNKVKLFDPHDDWGIIDVATVLRNVIIHPLNDHGDLIDGVLVLYARNPTISYSDIIKVGEIHLQGYCLNPIDSETWYEDDKKLINSEIEFLDEDDEPVKFSDSLFKNAKTANEEEILDTLKSEGPLEIVKESDGPYKHLKDLKPVEPLVSDLQLTKFQNTLAKLDAQTLIELYKYLNENL